MGGYIKFFGNGGNTMSFLIKDDDVSDKYNEVWNKIKKILNTKFHSMPVYGQKYIKLKVREFGAVIKTNFLGDETPKENVHHTSIACITIDSLMRMRKNELSATLLEECKYKTKKIKMFKFINTDLESESELESDTE